MDEHISTNFPEFIETVESAGKRIASAITPLGVCGGKDATGGHVESLTEAVMGMTAGLCRIAESLDNVAAAIREGRERV